MAQYLLLKSDGESDDPNVGLTSDSTSDGGVLNGDNYTADTIVDSTTAAAVFTDRDGTFDNTSGVADGIVEQFDTIGRTSIGNSIVTSIADKTITSASGEIAVGEILVEAVAASQIASLASQTATESFSDAFASAIDTSTLTTETIIEFSDSSVTTIGTIPASQFSALPADVEILIIAVASAATANTTPLTSTVTADSVASILPTVAVATPVSPTLDIVLNLRGTETGVGIEGTFADSLSANLIGLDLNLKVAKTRANGTGITTDPTTISFSDADTQQSSVSTIGTSGALSSSQTPRTPFTTNTFGSSTSTTTPNIVPQSATLSILGADLSTSVVVSAAVRNAVVSELSASGTTHSTAEALSQAAETLIDVGIADTQVEAAALVSKVAMKRLRPSGDTSVEISAQPQAFDTVDRTGRPMSFTISEAARPQFGISVVDGSSLSEGIPLINKTLVSAMNTSGEASSSAIGGSVTNIGTSPLLGQFTAIELLFLSFIGDNNAVVQNEQNYVEIVNQ